MLAELSLSHRNVVPLPSLLQTSLQGPPCIPARRTPIYHVMKGFIMATGTVKWFNATKGFGFIQPEDGATDVFVHISAVERAGMRTIVEGQRLSFDVVRDNRSGKSAAENLQAA